MRTLTYWIDKLSELPRQNAFIDKAYQFQVVHAAAVDAVIEEMRAANIPPSAPHGAAKESR